MNFKNSKNYINSISHILDSPITKKNDSTLNDYTLYDSTLYQDFINNIFAITLVNNKGRYQNIINTQKKMKGLPLHIWKATSTPNPKFVNRNGLKNGQICCYLSHLSLWKHIIDKRIKIATIFEDDIHIDENFFIHFKNLFKHLPKNFEYLNLFHNKLTIKKLNKKDKHIINNTKNYFMNSPDSSLGQVCYTITLQGAIKLYNFCNPTPQKPLRKTIDVYTRTMIQKKLINAFLIVRPFVTTNDYLKNTTIKSTYK